MPLSFKTITIPFDIDRTANIIILEVTFQNRDNERRIPMAFDTGASISTIPAEIALALGCDPSKPKRRVEIIAAGSMEYAPTVLIPCVKFTGFEFKNIEMACLNLPPKSSVAGLLGLNVIRNLDILISFSKNELTLRG